MGRDDKHGAEDLEHEDDDDGESHAADEPTAVWDESALRAAGLGDLWRKKEPEAPTKPATPAAATVESAPSIVVEDELGAQPSPVLAKPITQPPASRFGWGATIGLALLLGAVAYAIIRFVAR